MTDTRLAANVGLLGALFAIGFALMGFEMLGSRYLNPYFGGGITTWACLISVVLFSMMVGYFAGGYAVDARPGVNLLAGCVLLAAAAMLLVPPMADAALQAIMRTAGDGFWGVLTAAFGLSFVPVAFLSACSPFVVRLLLVELEAGGKTTGLVYSISTLGNVAGTLATTFYLIPNFGTRAITTAFGVMLGVVAALLYLSKRGLQRGLDSRLAVGLLACMLVCGGAHAADPARMHWQASYPEGPIWIGERLLYAEMPRHRIVEWSGGRRRTFWSEPGCGPTAIARFRGSQFIVLCHLGAKIVQLDQEGTKVLEFRASSAGEPLHNPNDCHSDGDGGVFFTDAGLFRLGAPASGKVFHIAAGGTLSKLVDGIAYANGIAVDFPNKRLLLSEHLARKVWQFHVHEDHTVADRKLFLDVDRYFAPDEIDFPETGPDGIEVDQAGNVFIAVYGAASMMAVMADGAVSRFPVPMKFVTNVAVSDRRAVVVGAFVNDRPPFSGRVEVLPRAAIIEMARRHVVRPVH
jgi:sugar lactone lactonase YvrE